MALGLSERLRVSFDMETTTEERQQQIRTKTRRYYALISNTLFDFHMCAFSNPLARFSVVILFYFINKTHQ